MKAKHLDAKGAFALLKESYTEFSKDKCMRLGAALAYYAIFSIAPLLLIAIGIVGAVYGQQAAQGQVTQQLTTVLGPQMAEAVGEIVKSAGQNSRGATLTGLALLLVGASGVFAQLKEALNTIWEVKPKPNQGIWGFIRSRLLTFGVVLVIGFLMLVSLILTTLVTAFNGYIEQSFGIPPFISQILAILVPFAVEVLLFALLFKLLPDAKVLWKNVWVGAAVTALLFEIGKAFLSWYLAHSSTTSSFGAVAAPVLVLVWVYYSSLILFFGAEFTEVWARATGHVIEPKANAMKETPEERAEQGMEPEIVPHPSPAAAMAGRNLGADEGTSYPSRGERGPIRVEPSLLSGSHRTPTTPRKERIAPLIASAALDFGDEEEFKDEKSRSLEISPRATHSANYNPVKELGAALGVGLLMGIISRARDGHRDELTPGQHLRIGTKAAFLAGAAALTKLGPRLMRSAGSRRAKATVSRTAQRIRSFGEELQHR